MQGRQHLSSHSLSPSPQWTQWKQTYNTGSCLMIRTMWSQVGRCSGYINNVNEKQRTKARSKVSFWNQLWWKLWWCSDSCWVVPSALLACLLFICSEYASIFVLGIYEGDGSMDTSAEVNHNQRAAGTLCESVPTPAEGSFENQMVDIDSDIF